MYELKKIGKLFMSKFVGTGPSPYKKRIYQATVSQRLRNTVLNPFHGTFHIFFFICFVLCYIINM